MMLVLFRNCWKDYVHVRVIEIRNSSVFIAMQRLRYMFHSYTMRYCQGVVRHKRTSSLVRGRVNATHVDVPILCISTGVERDREVAVGYYERNSNRLKK